MDDIYMLADTIIFNRIGGNLKTARLKQNMKSKGVTTVLVQRLATAT